MQAKYRGVAHPPPEWKLVGEDLRGEAFELFEGKIVLGVIHVDERPDGGARSIVHLLAPFNRVELSWSVDGESSETWKLGPTTNGGGSSYLERSFHGTTLNVELQAVDGIPCDRKAKLRIR